MKNKILRYRSILSKAKSGFSTKPKIALLTILIALVFIESGFVIAADAPEEEWSGTFGVGGSNADLGYSVQQICDRTDESEMRIRDRKINIKLKD